MRQHKESAAMMMRQGGSVVAVALSLLFTSGAEAKMAKSLSYDFEYAVTGAGGGSAQSPGGAYSVVTLITSEGCVGTAAASASYNLEPVISTSPAGTSGVGDWMLYY